MKIAITATGIDLDSEIDPRFGRCRYLIIVDLDTMQFEAVENTGALSSGGAGIATGQLVASKGIKAVLTGNCGPNAYKTLTTAGIKVVTGIAGTVRQAAQDFKAGLLKASSEPSVGAHHGSN